MNTTIAPHGTTVLYAPLTGVVMLMEEVPDPTFSEKMLGDGIAIDPLAETLHAPCRATITQLPKTGHSLTLKTDDGIEILLHIGLETVLLEGNGFTPLVKEGDTVEAGAPLINFDADYLADHAYSLVSMLVITEGGNIVSRPDTPEKVEAGKTPLLILRSEATPEVDDPQSAEQEALTSKQITIPNPAGLHARPAAVLANSAKQFAASIRLEKNGKQANAKSLVSVMGLAVENGDLVTVVATGTDAEEALSTLVPLIESGLGEALHGIPVTVKTPPVDPAKPASTDPNIFVGVSASPGLVAGRVFQLRHADVPVEKNGKGAEAERVSFFDALAEGKKALAELQDDLRKRADGEKAAIFAAHQELIEDPELLDATEQGITRGESAAYAWKQAFTQQADTLAQLNNELLAGRANDIRDVGRRVLLLLTGIAPTMPEIPANVILLAENLTPSDTAGLDKSKILGFATTVGSATSHVAILARSASIPAIAAVEERALTIPDGTMIILDGGKGEIRLNPSLEDITRAQELQAALSYRRKADLSVADKPAVTIDNHRIKVVANIGSVAEAEEVPELGAEGVGLLRSEFLFLQRGQAPELSEQAAVYTTIAKTLGKERDLVVRTLDVGGDKPLAYLPMPHEDNPFLGVRGIRLSLIDDTLLTLQVRAILSAAPYSRLHIMFPMVTSVEEFRKAKLIVLQEIEKLGITEPVKIGVMIEVPSAAIMAEGLAREADFFSIGTNDLTQYTLAMDRGNPRLAKMVDSLHPAVLNLIARTVEGAHKHGRPVGVCGGLASELSAVPILLGLGVDELSVAVPAIPAVKATVRRQDMKKCRALAGEVLSMLTAAEVRERLAEFEDEK